MMTQQERDDLVAYYRGNVERLIKLAPHAPFMMPKPAPTEQVQRAAYSIHGACADILQAVQDVTDPQAAYEIWQMVENAWRAIDAVSHAAQAKAESLNKEAK
jgi:hypothetical protein